VGDETINVKIYSQAAPAVANIVTRTLEYDVFMEPVPVEGAGSGFVIDPAGLIITNYHVVEDAFEITVMLSDGSLLPGKMLSASRLADIAIVKVEPDHPLAAAHWGNSDSLRVGDQVLAAGNPFGLGLSVSAGIAGVYARMGKLNEARRMLEELKATTDPAIFADIPVARAYAALGNKDEAFKVLFRLVEERESYATYIKADPPLDSLHTDPRWKELLRRMNFLPD